MSQLVLARTVGESITIGAEIVITVIAIEGGVVRLRVRAPRELDVSRTDNRNGRPTPVKDNNHE